MEGKEGAQERGMLRSQNHGSLSGISRVLATCLGSRAGQRLKREKGEGDTQEQKSSRSGEPDIFGRSPRGRGSGEEQDRRQILRTGPPGGD